MNIEDRLTELETRMVFAENAAEEMNRTIVMQDQEISSLKNYCKELKKKLDELKDNTSGEPLGFDRPPHY